MKGRERMNNRTPHRFLAIAAGWVEALGFATGAAAQAHRTPFLSQPTESLQGMGDYTSLTLDATGRTHLAWFDASRGALVYAVQTFTGWRTEVVDANGTVGWYASLALDSHGHESIAYYDVTHGALKFASRDGGRWTTQTVESSAAGVGHYCSLAFGPNDAPAISYYDAQNLCLRFATRANGVWTAETVDGAENAADVQADRRVIDVYLGH